jgi:hypothetical protein
VGEVPFRPTRQPNGMGRQFLVVSANVGRDDKWEQRAIGNLTTPDLNGPRPAPFVVAPERPAGTKRVSPQRGPRILRAERGAKRRGFCAAERTREGRAGAQALGPLLETGK